MVLPHTRAHHCVVVKLIGFFIAKWRGEKRQGKVASVYISLTLVDIEYLFTSLKVIGLSSSVSFVCLLSLFLLGSSSFSGQFTGVHEQNQCPHFLWYVMFVFGHLYKNYFVEQII